MMATRVFRARLWCVLAGSVCLSLPTSARHGTQEPAAPSLRTLIVGGGPDRMHNQVAIESNVRYVGRLLPPQSPFHVLFTDGDPRSENVQFRRDDRRLAYRAPDLPRLDGPAEPENIRAELGAMADDVRVQPATAVMIYFTGHGSPSFRSAYTNNSFDLWTGRQMTVRDLATALRTFPAATTISLIMVQCYSGAFGNVLFEDGNPAGAPIDQHVAGFFAASPQRIAAGCTAEINEAEYHDFTSYFFAALSGVDRMGAAVSGADYDHDGRVGMNEAFAWSLVHDNSIDTPVCTSDTFLRRFVELADAEIFEKSYQQVQTWASPAQLAALDGLSDLMRLEGDERLGAAFGAFRKINQFSNTATNARLIRFVELARSIVLAHVLAETGPDGLKARYADLLKAESGNPLK